MNEKVQAFMEWLRKEMKSTQGEPWTEDEIMNAIEDFGLSDVPFDEFVDKDGNTIIHLVQELTRDGRSLANLLWCNRRDGKNFEWFPVTKKNNAGETPLDIAIKQKDLADIATLITYHDYDKKVQEEIYNSIIEIIKNHDII